MFRTAFILLLCLGVLAMPSYAAVRCAESCASPSDSPDKCCGHGKPSPLGNDSGQPDTGRQTIAPCCGFVAVAQIDEHPAIGTGMVTTFAALAPTNPDSLAQQTIFHPPRA